LEGRWAQLTLSALYDGAYDIKDIRQDDLTSLVREKLFHNEVSRRRKADFAVANALIISQMSANVPAKGTLLQEVIGDLQSAYSPWEVDNRSEDTKEQDENESLEEMYHRVTEQYRESQKDE